MADINYIEENIISIGMGIGIIGAVISVILTVIFLFGMGIYCGDISQSAKYHEKKAFQQFLMDNPDDKIFLNEHELTKFTSGKITTPYVLKIITSTKEYEIFIDGLAPIETADSEFLIDHDSMTDTFQISQIKDADTIKKLQKDHKNTFIKTKGYTWYWVKKIILSVIIIIIFTPPCVKWYCKSVYPYVRRKIEELIDK